MFAFKGYDVSEVYRVRRSRRGTVNVRQERKQPECRVVYEQTLNLKLKGSKECLDSFPQ